MLDNNTAFVYTLTISLSWSAWLMRRISLPSHHIGYALFIADDLFIYAITRYELGRHDRWQLSRGRSHYFLPLLTMAFRTRAAASFAIIYHFRLMLLGQILPPLHYQTYWFGMTILRLHITTELFRYFPSLSIWRGFLMVDFTLSAKYRASRFLFKSLILVLTWFFNASRVLMPSFKPS